MVNDANDFVGLAQWQAATLYIGFLKDKKPMEGLVAHIENKSNYSSTFQKRWEKLHEAVESGDREKIMHYALGPKEGGVNWPIEWKSLGEKYEKKLKIVFK